MTTSFGHSGNSRGESHRSQREDNPKGWMAAHLVAASVARARSSDDTNAVAVSARQQANVAFIANTNGAACCGLGDAPGIPVAYRNITVSSGLPSAVPNSDPSPKIICTIPVAKPRYSIFYCGLTRSLSDHERDAHPRSDENGQATGVHYLGVIPRAYRLFSEQ